MVQDGFVFEKKSIFLCVGLATVNKFFSYKFAKKNNFKMAAKSPFGWPSFSIPTIDAVTRLCRTRHPIRCTLDINFGVALPKQSVNQINRKFRVATEIGSTFFGCWSVTGQLKK
jgi:hypothetical protein